MKICFCIPHSYALFEPSSKHPFGGSEVQSHLLAQGLTRLPGTEISFVVLDHKQASVRRFGTIKVYKHGFYTAYPKKIDRYRDEICGIRFKQTSFPWIDFKGKKPSAFYKSFLVRLYDLRLDILRRLVPSLFIEHYEIMADQFGVFKKVDADIYVASGVHETAAEVAAFCRHYGKTFILLAASDYDFAPEHAENTWEKDRYDSYGHLCYYAIQQADAIVTQTQLQQRLLKERFGRESTVISNPVDLDNVVDAPAYADRKYALWIGKADRVKRPDLMLELARRMPDIPCKMVMNPSRPEIFKQIHDEAPSNVELLDYVPFDKIEELFVGAFVFVNTSDFEGFPNTFLQAGKYGVPLLSLNADPDNMIKNFDCGLAAAGDFEALAGGLELIHSDTARAAQYSQNIRQYVRSHHNLNSKAIELNQVFLNSMQNKKNRPVD